MHGQLASLGLHSCVDPKRSQSVAAPLKEGPASSIASLQAHPKSELVNVSAPACVREDLLQALQK